MKKNHLLISIIKQIWKSKLLITMRAALFIVIVSVAQAFAVTTYSQSTRLGLNMKNSSVKVILGQIEDQSEFYFIYDATVVDVERKTSIKSKEGLILKILDEIFKGTEVIYKVSGRQIALAVSKPILVLQQQKSITGTVTDDSGQPLPGVTVVVKGTIQGTVTNTDGNYFLGNASSDATLVFSFVGMKTTQVPVVGQTSINVVLEEESIGIEEIVAIGYGTMKKSDLTGAIVSVNSDKFKMQPLVQVSDILQGRSSGVVATSTSGIVGSTPRIRVRGITSINTGNNPLWVIDGVIGGTVTNPDDIESIEILKDASSTAIYGSRGANGVILVTTKHGKVGKTQFSVSSNTGISNIAKQWDLMNAYEYAVAYNDIMGSGTFDDNELAAYKNGTKGIDWVDLMTQTGVLQDYRLSISGGNQKSKFNISGNFVNQTGITITSKYKRYNFKVNYITQLTPWMKVLTDISMTKNSYHNQGSLNDFRAILDYSPTMELINEDGVCYEDNYNTIHSSPWADKKYVNEDSEAHMANTLINFTVNLTKGLTFSALGSVLYRQDEEYSFGSAKRYSGAQSFMTNSESRSIKWQTTENLTYKKDFGENHLTLTGVFEATKSENPYLNLTGNNLLSEKVYYWSVSNAENSTCENGYIDESMSSFFARGAYNFKGRYFVTGTIRADGSSKFQGDNKWGYFPSGALAWDISQEDFMKNQNLFQQLKLRTSYGMTGNQGIEPYATLGLMTYEEYVYATQSTLHPGYWQSTFATPGLTWEKTYQWNVGMDMSMLDQRLNITAELYRKDTKDMLFEKSIPYYDGGGSYWTNQGEIRNTGFELSINADLLKDTEFKWQSYLNVSYNKSKIIDLAGEDYIIPDASRGDLMTPSFIMKPGHPIGMFYIYDYAGIDDEGRNLYRTVEGGTTTSPGENDKIFTGNSIPEWTLGWNNNFRWKNWEANVFLRSDLGCDKLNVIKFSLTSMVGASRFIRLQEAYTKNWDKVSNKADAVYSSLTNGNNQYEGASTQWLENASFLRCQNLSFAYHIPQRILKAGELVLSVSAQNLFIITKYEGMDPETVSEDENDQQSGYDGGSYPLPKTFNVGVKFNF